MKPPLRRFWYRKSEDEARVDRARARYNKGRVWFVIWKMRQQKRERPTGRSVCNRPNLQQIPKALPEAKRVMKALRRESEWAWNESSS